MATTFATSSFLAEPFCPQPGIKKRGHCFLQMSRNQSCWPNNPFSNTNVLFVGAISRGGIDLLAFRFFDFLLNLVVHELRSSQPAIISLTFILSLH